jgi:precorrin-6B methylase 2
MNKKALNPLSAEKPIATQKHEIRPTQSLELLKELHILTRDGKLNQDSRRKLKQVYHLVQFIEPLLKEVLERKNAICLVDHGAGKSYLGFILNDLFCKLQDKPSHIIGIEVREELVRNAQALAQRLSFNNMQFLHLSAENSLHSDLLPKEVDVVTALHACNTATDDAIRFALEKKAKHIVLVPCCQAEVASMLRKQKSHSLKNEISEIWRHPLHTREFGSHITNVLRCLQLESHGYSVTVTELVGWEHSMKNELIVATQNNKPGKSAKERKAKILQEIGLESLAERFS